MYDSPKAAHLRATRDGKDLPRMDYNSLRLRWEFAMEIRPIAPDMLHLTPNVVETVTDMLQFFNLTNQHTGIVLEFLEPLETKCYTRTVAS
jgi:hypothetical protein